MFYTKYLRNLSLERLKKIRIKNPELIPIAVQYHCHDFYTKLYKHKYSFKFDTVLHQFLETEEHQILQGVPKNMGIQ